MKKHRKRYFVHNYVHTEKQHSSFFPRLVDLTNDCDKNQEEDDYEEEAVGFSIDKCASLSIGSINK